MTSSDLEGHSYCNSSNDMACSRGPSAVAELLVKTQRRLHSVKMTTRSRAMSRAALTAKHDTLVRRATGWQGAPDSQQAKKLVVIKCLFYCEIYIL